MARSFNRRRRRSGVKQGSVYDLRFRAGRKVGMADSGWISAGDKAKGKYIHVRGLAVARTRHNALVMGFLRKRNHPVAFIRQENAVTTLCEAVDMLPLEIVVRGRALEGCVTQFGGTVGELFDPPRVFLYAKKALDRRDPANPKWVSLHDIKQGDGDTPAGVDTDPLIWERPDGLWAIHSAKGRFDPDKPLHVCAPLVPADTLAAAKRLALAAFADLRDAIGNLERHDLEALGFGIWKAELADFKVEVGWLTWAATGNRWLVIADVLPLDSLRIVTNGAFKNWRKWLSKEPFRKCKTRQPKVIERMLVGPRGAYTKGTAVLELLHKAA